VESQHTWYQIKKGSYIELSALINPTMATINMSGREIALKDVGGFLLKNSCPIFTPIIVGISSQAI